MHYASFPTTVAQAGGITREEAQRAIETTLRTLAERITGGVARDIAAFLPNEVRHNLADTPGGDPADPAPGAPARPPGEPRRAQD